ncbi:unnamed protein product [Closterium sp. NIES-65]|nr:unnamed protein product [Closterium sp. NIES-65]
MASPVTASISTARLAQPIASLSASPSWQQPFVGLQSQSSSVASLRGGARSLSDRLFHTVAAATSAARPAGAGRRARVVMMPIGTPKVPYRTPGEGGWQWVDIWNVLYRERIIFIGQFMDEEYTNQVLATMLYLDSLDSSKPMYMYINSPGGELTPTLALYDTIRSIKSPVGTLALGYAYNNAGFLLAAGTKGLRVAMPMTRVALQSPAGAARGQADDIQNEARELSRVRTYVFGELAKMSGQPVEKVTKDLSRIKRFSAQEALDYGLIDRIVRPRRNLAMVTDDALGLLGEGHLVSEFRAFASRFAKAYETQHEALTRFRIFTQNWKLIHEANSANLPYKLEINEFADISWEEFKQHKLGASQNCSATEGGHVLTYKNLPLRKDWRDEGVVSPVKNQGHCGSCWTFSTTGALEAAYLQKTGNFVSLSEQQLVDCAGEYNNHGCNGGLPSQAFEYVKYNGGIDTEDAYPYLGQNDQCHFAPKRVGARVADVVNITEYDEASLQDAVAFTLASRDLILSIMPFWRLEYVWCGNLCVLSGTRRLVHVYHWPDRLTENEWKAATSGGAFAVGNLLSRLVYFSYGSANGE